MHGPLNVICVLFIFCADLWLVHMKRMVMQRIVRIYHP